MNHLLNLNVLSFQLFGADGIIGLRELVLIVFLIALIVTFVVIRRRGQ